MIIETLTQKEWLALHQRRDMVSASQVFTLTGENTYESPYALWCRKMGRMAWPDQTLQMRRGHALEGLCAELYTESSPERLDALLDDWGDYAIVRHPDYPWLFCTPDRIAEEKYPVEFKTTSNFKAWMEDAPLSAQTQLQVQMACLGADKGSIGALLGGFSEEFLVYDFERNDGLIEELILLAREFRDYCMNDVAPPVDGSGSTSLALKAMYPRPTEGNTVQLPATAAMWASEWAGVKESAKILEEREKQLKNQLIEAIGDGEYGQCGDLMFSYRAQTRKGYLKVPTEQWAILKNNQIPFEETPETTFRVLREVKPKKQKKQETGGYEIE